MMPSSARRFKSRDAWANITRQLLRAVLTFVLSLEQIAARLGKRGRLAVSREEQASA
jgi:hypothetical protein